MREAMKWDTSFQYHAVGACSGHYLQHLLEIELVTVMTKRNSANEIP
jgi:hypothetical protein